MRLIRQSKCENSPAFSLEWEKAGEFSCLWPNRVLSFLAIVIPCGRMEGCRASFQQSLICYLLGGDGCLPVLVARGASMKPSAQGGGAGAGTFGYD